MRLLRVDCCIPESQRLRCADSEMKVVILFKEITALEKERVMKVSILSANNRVLALPTVCHLKKAPYIKRKIVVAEVLTLLAILGTRLAQPTIIW